MPVPIQVWVDAYPVLSETFVANEVSALRQLGHPVEVVAGRGDADRVLRASWAAMARLALRHPRGVGRDLRARRRWRRDEPVAPLRELAAAVLATGPDTRLHAHFARGAALNAMRASALSGRPWSLTAHAYDIYARPENLREKLARASFVTSGCDYTVRDLAALTARPVHRIVMGVDPDAFARRAQYGREPLVVAIGRLVEKKGFVHLVRAAARLAGVRVEIAGEGPLRAELEAEIDRLGAPVALLGERSPSEIRDLLERAALLAAPCVIAADGDRDSMPVVVKEALAMEVPVVASDEVGLPELVRPAFGRLVPPGDPAALASAVGELLALPAEERAAMGRAGRAFVTEQAHVRRETGRLSALLSREP